MEDHGDNSGFMRAFGQLANAMGGGGDIGQSFPQSDADDFGKGARFIPGNVTLARRAGKKVTFVTNCTSCCWYWEMPDGSREYHWDPFAHQQIAQANGHGPNEEAGSCPTCGNTHTNGGSVSAEELAKE